jgi:hypothetical protein
MPIGGTPDDGAISFDISANTGPMNQALSKTQQQFTRQFKGMGKAAQDFGKRHLPTFGKIITATGRWYKSNAKLAKQEEQLIDHMRSMDKAITKLGRQRGTADADEIKKIDEKIKKINALKAAKEKASKDVKEGRAKASRVVEPLKAADKAAGKIAGEFVSKAAAPFSKLASRDILGAIEAGGEFVGHAIEKSFKGVSATMKVTSKFFGKTVGDWMWKGAKSQWAKGGVKGKAGAIAAGAGAGVMKGVGGAMKGMEKAAGAMAAVGPLLSASVGILMQIVKGLLDAESAAKEFNAGLLATSSTAEFLAAAGGDSSAAFKKMEGTVEGIRKAATDASENLAWGINKKTHMEFWNTLTAEGVSLNRIEKEAEAAGRSVEDFSAEMVHVGVAYSRSFGVSLSEISTLQGEMMREMGMSVDSTTHAFSMMQTAATDSGIASNKFFAIMRGMSADLSLFNLRMEDAVGTLKLLGKVMSPRNAEAFLKTITSFYKGQDLQSRIKATLLGGGVAGTKKRLQKDVDTRITSIKGQAEKLMSQKDVEDAIRGGPKKMTEILTKYQSELAGEGGGAITEGIMQANRMQGKLTQGGLISVASALKDASPISVIEQLDANARSAGAKTGMEDLQDDQIVAFTSMAGMSDEQLDQAIQAKQGIMMMREGIVARLKSGEKLSTEQKTMLDNMGINQDDANAMAKVQGQSDRSIWASMTNLQQKELTGSETQEDIAKEQLKLAKDQQKLTTSFSSQLDTIIDGLMEYVYGITKDIFDLLNEFMTSSGSWWEKLIGVLTYMYEGFLKGMFRLIPGLGDGIDGAIEGLGKKVREWAGATPGGKGKTEEEKVKSMQRSLRAKGDPTSIEILKATREQGGLTKLLGTKLEGAQAEGKGKPSKVVWDAVQDLAAKGGMQKGPEAMDKLSKVMANSGLDKDKQGKMLAAMRSGKSIGEAAMGAGLSAADFITLAKAMSTGLDQSALMNSMAQMAPVPGAAPAAPGAAGAKPPSAVAAATATSAAPGTGGAPGAAPGTTAAGAPAAPATRTGVTVPGPPGAPDAPAVTAEATAVTADNTEAAAATLVNMDSKQGENVKALTGKTGQGVQLGDAKQPFYDGMEKATLKAMQQALFEYWLYSASEEDVNAVLKKMVDSKTEITAGNLVEMVTKQAKGGSITTGVKGGNEPADKPADPNAPKVPPAPPHAGGGYVVDTSGPLARVIRAPAGEAFTAIGKGETITPKGGGGGGGSIKVELSFKDDMDRYVEAKVIDTTYENKRRQRTS